MDFLQQRKLGQMPYHIQLSNSTRYDVPLHRANSSETYRQLYNQSIQNPDKFWAHQAREIIHWDRDFETIHQGSFEHGDNAWFVEGRLNASYNCVDRWAKSKPDAVAIIHEPDNPEHTSRTITFRELLREISRVAWVLKHMGVCKGDTVAIYLPMIPETFIAILACSRIGAIHSVIFAGFSSQGMRDRILDAGSKVVITADEGCRGGKTVPLKNLVDQAVEHCPTVQSCPVVHRTGNPKTKIHPRDKWWHEETAKWSSYYPPESMSSEDPLFLLYTSGSTGKPKGLMHTTAGYLIGAALSTKYVFDIHAESDVFFCAGDIGWITGHTYGLYGPLMNGCATLIYEGTPSFPSVTRYWEIIAKHRVTQFYTAPTAIRLLKRAHNAHIPDNSAHLRVMGSVGEPLAANVWDWFFDQVGKSKAHVVDTFFQTETGSHLISPVAGVTSTKPGCCSLPFLGVETAILDPKSGAEVSTAGVEGVLVVKKPIPSMARSIWGDHSRFLSVYYVPYPGCYFTGDSAIRDEEGCYWIKGRVDDVVNVAAHRLSTAELEAALLEHPAFAEVAVVGVADYLMGQAVVAFISQRANVACVDVKKAAVERIREKVGSFATPKYAISVNDLPRTRSGKIMRRLLRKIWCGETDSLGDVSTLINPSCLQGIVEVVQAVQAEALQA